jgi:hypothetical protein
MEAENRDNIFVILGNILHLYARNKSDEQPEYWHETDDTTPEIDGFIARLRQSGLVQLIKKTESDQN